MVPAAGWCHFLREEPWSRSAHFGRGESERLVEVLRTKESAGRPGLGVKILEVAIYR